MGTSDIVRVVSRMTGFGQPIIRRFEAATNSDAELLAAVQQHCDDRNQSSCPCPICGGRQKVTLRHDGSEIDPVTLKQFETKPVMNRRHSDMTKLGPTVVAMLDRSRRDP